MITAEEALHLAKKRLGEQGEDLVNKINNVIQMVADLTTVVNGKVDSSDFNLFDVITPSFTSLPMTFYSSYLKSDCKLVGNAIHLSTPTAGDIDWSVVFSDGSLTISGTFHGSTATTASMSIWLPTNTITLT